MPRNWSTRTLYVRVLGFIADQGFDETDTIGDLLASMKDEIVAEALDA